MTPAYFRERGWWTPNQIRDNLLEHPTPDTTRVSLLRKLAIDEQARRKSLPEQYVECPVCKGFHAQLENIDKLCEKHEAATAPMRYDLKHGMKKL